MQSQRCICNVAIDKCMTSKTVKKTPPRKNPDDVLLRALQKMAFTFFVKQVDAKTGLVFDSTQPNAPSSIAATGFALSSYLVASERGWMTRSKARSPHIGGSALFSTTPMSTVRRMASDTRDFSTTSSTCRNRSAGVEQRAVDDRHGVAAGRDVDFSPANYFDGDDADEREIRDKDRYLRPHRLVLGAERRGSDLEHGLDAGEWVPARVAMDH